ncbi:MAG: hypothetical protein HOW97_34150 [Catenulispora sp.]|nr:hypothetical protein [Catenulispora sp.]
MSPISCPCAALRPAAVINAEIRDLVRRTRVWDEEALDALARLQAEWRAAVAREATLAA